MSVIREVYSEMDEPKEEYSVACPAEPPMGYLPYQARFGEHVDSLRELIKQDIRYKSPEWWACYQCYIAGLRDAVQDEMEALKAQASQ